ncbi:phosphatase PAP2 family protein [Erwinia sp. AnSW2-5]|uniref:acid phosphatase n=1 Tax=Erwinia sp. AnSW2-5 TaxID=3367692 RepID=UPI00385EA666
MKHHFLYSGLLLSGALFAHTQAQANTTDGIAPFHTAADVVNSQFYLPPPPKDDSPAFTLDKAAYLAGYAMKGSPRWQQATQDARLDTASMAKTFSPALGVTLSETQTPATWKMINDLKLPGSDYAPGGAKKYYMRTRPFVVFNHHTCLPEDEAELRKDGSYPSGHTSYGTLLGLVLAEAKPDRAQELAKRAYEFGQSRVICGAHWQSDVDAGRYVGAAEFAHLHTIPAFMTALKQVKQELNH